MKPYKKEKLDLSKLTSISSSPHKLYSKLSLEPVNCGGCIVKVDVNNLDDVLYFYHELRNNLFPPIYSSYQDDFPNLDELYMGADIEAKNFADEQKRLDKDYLNNFSSHSELIVPKKDMVNDSGRETLAYIHIL